MIAPLVRRPTGVAWVCLTLCVPPASAANDQAQTASPDGHRGASAASDRAADPAPGVDLPELEIRGARPWLLASQCVSGDYYTQIRGSIPTAAMRVERLTPSSDQGPLGGAQTMAILSPLPPDELLPARIDFTSLVARGFAPEPLRLPLPNLRDSTSRQVGVLADELGSP